MSEKAHFSQNNHPKIRQNSKFIQKKRSDSFIRVIKIFPKWGNGSNSLTRLVANEFVLSVLPNQRSKGLSRQAKSCKTGWPNFSKLASLGFLILGTLEFLWDSVQTALTSSTRAHLWNYLIKILSTLFFQLQNLVHA